VTPSLLSRKVVFDRLGRRRRSGRPARQDPAAIAYCNFKNIAFEENHVFVPRRCFRLEFPLETKFQYERPLVRLEEDLRFRSFTHLDPRGCTRNCQTAQIEKSARLCCTVTSRPLMVI
jgi:hypothetical protein